MLHLFLPAVCTGPMNGVKSATVNFTKDEVIERRGTAAFYILQGGDSVSRTLLSAQKHAEKRRKRDTDMGAKWPGKNDDKNQIIDWQGGER